MLVLRDLLALELNPVKIVTHHECAIVFDFIPIETEKGMLGFKIANLQDAIDLGMKSRTATGKSKFCFRQGQILESLAIVEIRQAIQCVLLSCRQHGQQLIFSCHYSMGCLGPEY